MSNMRKRIRRLKYRLYNLKNTLKRVLKINVDIIFTIVFVLLALFSRKGIPNFLGISTAQVIQRVSTIIVGSLASILGIVVAISLVAFEVLRKLYASYAFRELFQSRKLRHLFVIFISTILISTISVIAIKRPITVQNINLFYLSLFLFAYCIVRLYPLSKSILISTISKRKIREIANRIDFFSVDRLRSSYHLEAQDYLAAVENNPIFVLSEVAIRTIKEGDRITPQFVLMEATEKLKKILDELIEHQSVRETINAFLVIIKNAAEHAIEQKQESAVRTALSAIEEIHSYCAKHGIAYYEVEELNGELESIISKAIDAKLDAVVYRGFWTIKRILFKHLKKNVPSENEIWSLHIGHDLKLKKDIPVDHDKSLQWDSVRSRYLGMLVRLINKSIEVHNRKLVGDGLYCISNIVSEVSNLENLGKIQKLAILGDSYYNSEELILKCGDEGLYGEGLASYPIDSALFVRGIEKEREDFSKEALMRYGDTLIRLAPKVTLTWHDLNMLGTIGRASVEKIGEGCIYTESVLFICDVFNKIIEELEENIRVDNEQTYVEIYNQVKSLKGWMETHGKHDNDVEQKIDILLGKFKNIEKLKAEFQRDKGVKWPTLKKGRKNQN